MLNTGKLKSDIMKPYISLHPMGPCHTLYINLVYAYLTESNCVSGTSGKSGVPVTGKPPNATG